MKKRILSLMITLSMVISMFPMTAVNATGDPLDPLMVELIARATDIDVPDCFFACEDPESSCGGALACNISNNHHPGEPCIRAQDCENDPEDWVSFTGTPLAITGNGQFTIKLDDMDTQATTLSTTAKRQWFSDLGIFSAGTDFAMWCNGVIATDNRKCDCGKLAQDVNTNPAFAHAPQHRFEFANQAPPRFRQAHIEIDTIVVNGDINIDNTWSKNFDTHSNAVPHRRNLLDIWSDWNNHPFRADVTLWSAYSVEEDSHGKNWGRSLTGANILTKPSAVDTHATEIGFGNNAQPVVVNSIEVTFTVSNVPDNPCNNEGQRDTYGNKCWEWECGAHLVEVLGDLYCTASTNQLDFSYRNLGWFDFMVHDGISHVPNVEWWRFENIEELNLEGNKLGDLAPFMELGHSLRRLDISENPITNYGTIGAFWKLEHLSFNNHNDDRSQKMNNTQLEQFVNALPKSLPGLEIRGHRITDVTSLAQLTDLEHISIGYQWDDNGAFISDLAPLSVLTKLRNFDIGGSDVSDISVVANWTDLESLSVQQSKVTSLSALTNLTNLKDLNFSNHCNQTKAQGRFNQISDLEPLTNLNELKSLNLYGNEVVDLTPLANKPELHYLDLNQNNIVDITPLELLGNLQTLGLSGNNISSISVFETSATLKNSLQNLSLGDNPILIDTANADRFKPLESLTYLRHLAIDASGCECGIGCNVKKGVRIDSDMLNKLVESIKDLPELNDLWLNGNELTNISSLVSSPLGAQLETLQLNNQWWTKEQWDAHSASQRVAHSPLDVTQIKASTMPSLRFLNLSWLSLKNIDLHALDDMGNGSADSIIPQLYSLDISQNDLSDVFPLRSFAIETLSGAPKGNYHLNMSNNFFNIDALNADVTPCSCCNDTRGFLPRMKERFDPWSFNYTPQKSGDGDTGTKCDVCETFNCVCCKICDKHHDCECDAIRVQLIANNSNNWTAKTGRSVTINSNGYYTLSVDNISSAQDITNITHLGVFSSGYDFGNEHPDETDSAAKPNTKAMARFENANVNISHVKINDVEFDSEAFAEYILLIDPEDPSNPNGGYTAAEIWNGWHAPNQRLQGGNTVLIPEAGNAETFTLPSGGKINSIELILEVTGVLCIDCHKDPCECEFVDVELSVAHHGVNGDWSPQPLSGDSVRITDSGNYTVKIENIDIPGISQLGFFSAGARINAWPYNFEFSKPTPPALANSNLKINEVKINGTVIEHDFDLPKLSIFNSPTEPVYGYITPEIWNAFFSPRNHLKAGTNVFIETSGSQDFFRLTSGNINSIEISFSVEVIGKQSYSCADGDCGNCLACGYPCIDGCGDMLQCYCRMCGDCGRWNGTKPDHAQEYDLMPCACDLPTEDGDEFDVVLYVQDGEAWAIHESTPVTINGNGEYEMTLNLGSGFTQIPAIGIGSKGGKFGWWGEADGGPDKAEDWGANAQKTPTRFRDSVMELEKVEINGTAVNINSIGHTDWGYVTSTAWAPTRGYTRYLVWNAFFEPEKRLSGSNLRFVKDPEQQGVFDTEFEALGLQNNAPITSIKVTFSVSEVPCLTAGCDEVDCPPCDEDGCEDLIVCNCNCCDDGVNCGDTREIDDCTVCATCERVVGTHDWNDWGADSSNCKRTCKISGCLAEQTHATDSDNAKVTDCTVDSVCETCDRVVEEKEANHATHTDYDGDCSNAVLCDFGGTCTHVVLEVHAEHIAGADNGDCTTAIICDRAGCTQVAVEAKTHVSDGKNGEDCGVDSKCANDGCIQVIADEMAKTHEPTTADCTKCDDCTITTIPNASHTFTADMQQKGTTEHDFKCEDCDVRGGAVDCVSTQASISARTTNCALNEYCECGNITQEGNLDHAPHNQEAVNANCMLALLCICSHEIAPAAAEHVAKDGDCTSCKNCTTTNTPTGSAPGLEANHAIANGSDVAENCTVDTLCSCGFVMIAGKTAHTPTIEDCTKCADCTITAIPSSNHAFTDDMQQTGINQHDFKCTTCNTRGGVVSCSINNQSAVDADCTVDAVCVCGRVMEAGEDTHTPTPADCTKCANCTITAIPSSNHAFTDDMQQTGTNQHDFKCTVCNVRGGAVNCATSNQSAVDADCTVNAVCVCNRTMTAGRGSHTFTADRQPKGTNAHDFSCTHCTTRGGDVTCTATPASVTAREADCTVATVCVCNNVITPAGTHSAKVDDCTACENCTTPIQGVSHIPKMTDCTECQNCTIAQIPNSKHEWDSWDTSLGQEATCTEAGHQKRKCKNCNVIDTQTRIIPERGHSWGAWSVDTATCVAGGNQTRSCTVASCNPNPQSRTTPPLGHTYGAWGTWNETTSATCITEGVQTRTRSCSRDGCSTPPQNETRPIPVLGHSFASDAWTVRTPATCTVAGVEEQICIRSGCTVASPTTRPIPATGHSYSAFTQTLAPTCTTVGKESRECTVAGCDVRANERDIPVLGHNWGNWNETLAPTCTTAGVEQRTCGRGSCSIAPETQAIPALGHDYNTWTERTAPTCTVAGVQEQICERGGCNVVSATTRPIPMTGHDMGDWDVCPNNSNRLVSECENPNCDYYDEFIDETACMHDWDILTPVGNTATCILGGMEIIYCNEASCNEFRTQATIPLGHDNTGDVANCTTAQVCARISCTFVIAVALDHDWNAWTVETTPTCTTTGMEERTCRRDSNCSVAPQTRVVAVLPHNYSGVWTETQAPTCTVVGKESRKCDDCDHRTGERDIPATGHSMNAWTQAIRATCTATGVMARNCTECNFTETRVITALGHAWNIGTAPGQATCTTAQVCGRSGCSAGTPALGHSFNGADCGVSTCTRNGDVCGVVFKLHANCSACGCGTCNAKCNVNCNYCLICGKCEDGGGCTCSGVTTINTGVGNKEIKVEDAKTNATGTNIILEIERFVVDAPPEDVNNFFEQLLIRLLGNLTQN
jgi:hypothetical protein